MSYTKRIVCLTSSWKFSGRCIAGKELATNGCGGWIRPVSARAKSEISDEERTCAGGEFAEPLDILDIPFERPVPERHQSENHLIDPAGRWVKAGQLAATEIERLLDHPAQLWLNGYSSNHGLNDRMSAATAEECRSSLALIDPEDPFVLLQEEDELPVRVRLEFVYNRVPYNFAVTDPTVLRAFRRKPRGRYPLAPSWLSVSLTERYEDGYCYKLAAAVIAKTGEA